MSTIFHELQTEMIPVLLEANIPALSAGTDPNGTAGYWSGTDPAVPKTPSTNPDPLTVLLFQQVIDLCNLSSESGYNANLTIPQKKALYTNIAAQLTSISTTVSAVATAFTTYATALPSS